MNTLKDFKNEIENLRTDMFRYGSSADVRLVASWVDRLAISLEKVSDSLDLMSEELNQLSKLRSHIEATKAKLGSHPKKVKRSKHKKSTKPKHKKKSSHKKSNKKRR